VSENLFLNSLLKRQHQRQSREPSLATAANGVAQRRPGPHKGRVLARTVAATPISVPVLPPTFERAAQPQPTPIVLPFISEEISERRPRGPGTCQQL